LPVPGRATRRVIRLDGDEGDDEQAALRLHDRADVQDAVTSSLAEIEKATLRIAALRCSSNLSQAAARLGMVPVSVSRWVALRKLSTLLYSVSAA
jgi:hypothetical protein